MQWDKMFAEEERNISGGWELSAGGWHVSGGTGSGDASVRVTHHITSLEVGTSVWTLGWLISEGNGTVGGMSVEWVWHISPWGVVYLWVGWHVSGVGEAHQWGVVYL